MQNTVQNGGNDVGTSGFFGDEFHKETWTLEAYTPASEFLNLG